MSARREVESYRRLLRALVIAFKAQRKTMAAIDDDNRRLARDTARIAKLITKVHVAYVTLTDDARKELDRARR